MGYIVYGMLKKLPQAIRMYSTDLNEQRIVVNICIFVWHGLFLANFSEYCTPLKAAAVFVTPTWIYSDDIACITAKQCSRRHPEQCW
jgi:hypothetical protein